MGVDEDGVDLGFRCPACGDAWWMAVPDMHNRWRCTSCEWISKIEGGVMELVPEDRDSAGIDDATIAAWLQRRPERPWDEVNRDFCNSVHRGCFPEAPAEA